VPSALNVRIFSAALLSRYLGAAGAPAAGGTTGLLFPYDNIAYARMDGYREVASAAAPFYVKVTIREPAPARTGRTTPARNRIVSGASGVVLDSAGYVATAAHIARSTTLEAVVQTIDGRELPARIIHVDNERDLAVLKIPADAASFTAPATAAARAGAPVLAVGTPDNEPGVVTVGRVVKPRLDTGIRYGDYGNPSPLLLDMHVEPGHSGGPVVNGQGHLVGMVIGFDMRRNKDGELVSTGSTYAVPAGDLTELVNLLKAQSSHGESVCFGGRIDPKCATSHTTLPTATWTVNARIIYAANGTPYS